MDAKQVWRAALGELQVSLSPANFETWLRDTQLVDVDEQRFRIGVPNGFAKDWLENRYRSLISQTLARIVGYSVQVEFAVVPPEPAEDSDHTNGTGTASSAPAPQVRLEPGRVGGEGGSANLNPRYTFANFIVGSANRLRPRREPVGRRTTRPRLQPALPVRRGGAGQDAPDARDRHPGDLEVPPQAGRLRDEREVHQ
jgi:chromosomal replication initiator protein